MITTIKVKYFDKDMPKLEFNEKGDWIDLRVANACVVGNNEVGIKKALKSRKTVDWDAENKIYYCSGDVVIMRLGVAIELDEWKKANVYPRSSTFANWGLILTNSIGCIDYLYKGDNDEWLAVFFATRNGFIEKYDRVVQFDTKDREVFRFKEVDILGDTDRGGHGTSGKQ